MSKRRGAGVRPLYAEPGAWRWRMSKGRGVCLRPILPADARRGVLHTGARALELAMFSF